MIKAGTLLQNRYEIISRIGSGGMADVYRAKDHRLNRYVAVKVLKKEFKDDKAFLSKFRVEAQAAAGLSHANIVNVYDVGEDRGLSFIVMELVEGITLKNYINKKGKLSVREATSIALQVAAGLEAAHSSGIVHRDVKPQNIIISMNGKAKIADFGIARAVSSNTISSNAMGSVHYSAPEQTRGGYSDAKSDIYSMGITMYEMLTGRVPFDGDSTVEVALKHLQEELPPPHQYTPEIPHSTEQIIIKCTQKSPDRRYRNMTELIRDLKESLVNPDGDFVRIPHVDRKAHTVPLSAAERQRLKNMTLPSYDRDLDTGAASTISENGTAGGDRRMYPYGGNYYQQSGYQDLTHHKEISDTQEYPREIHVRPASSDMERDYDPYEDEDDPYDDFDEEEPEKRVRHYDDDDVGSSRAEKIITVIGILAAVVAALVILALIARSLGLLPSGTAGESSQTVTTSDSSSSSASSSSASSASMVTVPDLRGYTEEAAQKTLSGLNLGFKYQGEAPSDEYAKGEVVSQSVEPNATVEVNTTVGYVLSSGPSTTLTVPALENYLLSDAQSALTSLGLNVTVDNTRYSSTVAEGHVISTNPGAGSSVTAGDTVTVYVSQGPESTAVEVPDVTGKTLEEAQTALDAVGLYAYVSQTYSDTVAEGVVISQGVSAGSSVESGTAITLTVSLGPEASEDEIVILDSSSVWMCSAQLNAPPDYNGEPVRIVLEQNGSSTTVFEGTTTFPYYLNVQGQTGVSEGTVYIYTLDPTTWQVTSKTRYDGLQFSEVQS